MLLSFSLMLAFFCLIYEFIHVSSSYLQLVVSIMHPERGVVGEGIGQERGIKLTQRKMYCPLSIVNRVVMHEAQLT